MICNLTFFHCPGDVASSCPAPRSWSPHTILVQDPNELLVGAVNKSSTYECLQHCKQTATDTCLRYHDGKCTCLPGFVQRKYIANGVEETEKFVTKEAYTIDERKKVLYSRCMFSDLLVLTELTRSLIFQYLHSTIKRNLFLTLGGGLTLHN